MEYFQPPPTNGGGAAALCQLPRPQWGTILASTPTCSPTTTATLAQVGVMALAAGLTKLSVQRPPPTQPSVRRKQ